MKNVNKVLGVVLALVMVLSVCSTVAFAAVAEGKYCAVTITPTSTNYSKGDKVTFNVEVQTASDVGPVDRAFPFIMLYNSDIFERCSTEESVTKHGFVAGTAIGDNIDLASSCVIDAINAGTILPEENEAGWDAGICIQIYPNDDSTGMDLTSGGVLFSFDLMLKDDVADGNYSVAYSLLDCEMGINYFNPKNEEVQAYFYDGSYYDAPAATVTVGAAATPIIKAVKDNGGNVLSYVGWGNYDETKDTCDGDMTTGKLNFAIRGTFDAADIAPVAGKISFDEGNKRTVQEIEALSASAKIGGVEKGPCSTQFIYGAENGEGSYEYFVVIEGVDYADITAGTLTVEITFGGTLTAGGAISGETVTVNLKDAYDAAVARTLPAYSAF